MLRRLLSWGFLALVLGLLVRQGLRMDWQAVGRALTDVAPADLALAAVLAGISHALYASFDLIGRHQSGHRLPVSRTLLIGFISYAFNLNFGALVGGIGFRFKLYARYGLRVGVISQVIALSVLTNWVGYCLIGGVVFLAWPPALPAHWELPPTGTRAIGAALLVVAVAYLASCAVLKERPLRWPKYRFRLPRPALAAVQFALSSCNWLLAAGIVYVLLGAKLDFHLVTSVFLLAAIAGAVAHVPAGLGVLETVFITLLAGAMAAPTLLAGLLAYRAVYYLGPLLVAAVALALTRKSRRVRRARTSSSVRA